MTPDLAPRSPCSHSPSSPWRAWRRAAAAVAPAAGAAGVISVSDATIDWPANPEIAAVRMVVHNRTGEADALIAIATPIGRAEVHRTDVDDAGTASMTD